MLSLTLQEEMSQEESEEDEHDEEGDPKLDSCMIHVEPALKSDIEQLTYPPSLLSQLALEAYDSDKGLVLAGKFSCTCSVHMHRFSDDYKR